uniref:B30.2/SPRY domain-containing protein n=1 Tax=Neogobius melanostomus TaxID=47308 RepID=A0A8C6T7E7_9GOBI
RGPRNPAGAVTSVQQFAVDVTLDPDTAHPALVLSEDLKQVHCGDVVKKLPDSPQRFTNHVIVLGKQSFSSGRFYFEVQVKGKTKWTLGVARESVNRKGQITASPKNGFWTIWLRDGDEYKSADDPSVPLSPQRPPQKVGVFVDYGAGLVSFYDVDSADLLYSFTNCSFREKLFPFFNLLYSFTNCSFREKLFPFLNPVPMTEEQTLLL